MHVPPAFKETILISLTNERKINVWIMLFVIALKMGGFKNKK